MKIAILGNRTDIFYEDKLYQLRLDTDSVSGTKHLNSHKELSEEYDIAFCVGYYKIIPEKYFKRPKHGTFVLHAADLPKGRGWAPVNWALIHGDDRIHMTSIKVDNGCDTGFYHLKSSCPLDPMDTFSSAYKKVEKEIEDHIVSIMIELYTTGSITLHEQVGEPTWNMRRRPEDSELDPHKTLAEQWNLLRATDNDEYPAFFKLNGKKIALTYKVENE